MILEDNINHSILRLPEKSNSGKCVIHHYYIYILYHYIIYIYTFEWDEFY